MSFKIVCGDRVFNDNEIISINDTSKQDLISASLSIDTFTAVIKSDDESISQYALNALVKLYRDAIHLQTVYLQSIERIAKNLWQINAVSAINALTSRKHYGGIWLTTQTAISVRDLINDICGDIPHIIQTAFAQENSPLYDPNETSVLKLRGWLPVATARDNLMQVLFVIGAVATCDLDGVIRIESLWSGFVGNIASTDIYSGAKMQYEAPVTKVSLTEHSWSESSEEIELFKANSVDHAVVEFSEPVYDVETLSQNTWSGTIHELGANYAVVSGSGALNGKKYYHSIRVLVREIAESVRPNERTVENATLVTLDNSASVLSRLYRRYICSNQVKGSVIYHGLKPGNRVCIYEPYAESETDAFIESANQIYSKTIKSNVECVSGFVPDYIAGSAYVTNHDLLVGVGEWVVPPHVVAVRAVLIGGGESGGKGLDGANGTNISRTFYNTDTVNVAAQNGSNGGNGGAAGDGGKILIVDNIDVSNVDKIPYNTGIGGAQSASVTKNAGTDTIFGKENSALYYTSGDGESSATGYTDVDGTVYALPGNAGTKGGNGGNGGSASGSGSDGEHGESVGQYAGGGLGSPLVFQSETLNANPVGVIGGFGGSGAAVGSNGNYAGYSESTGYVDGIINVFGENSNGVNGSDAASKASSVVYGTGGDGGNGGSGVGGLGGVRNSYWYFGELVKINVTLKAGKGGKGGKGGAAAKGCILLDYVQYLPKEAGVSVDTHPVTGSDPINRFCVDKYGRILIV